jgi:opacity protein-like surface antigen
MQPVVTLTGGMSTPMGQQNQSLTFANTDFNYQPHQSATDKPIIGGFIGAEYSFKPLWVLQSGFAFYQNHTTSIHGEEVQAPVISLDAVNQWNYRYKILSRQLLFENKISLIVKNHFRPYVIAGLGASFNHAYNFQVTPQNSGEVATAIYGSNMNKSFAGTLGLGGDFDLDTHTRIGIGYRFAYLGESDLGKGTLDTGAGGSVFSLPALKSNHSYNQEILIQFTYLIYKM